MIPETSLPLIRTSKKALNDLFDRHQSELADCRIFDEANVHISDAEEQMIIALEALAEVEAAIEDYLEGYYANLPQEDYETYRDPSVFIKKWH